MSTNARIIEKTLVLLVTLAGAMAFVIHRTETEVHHHEMSWLAAIVIALVLALIAAPFAYRYARDSRR